MREMTVEAQVALESRLVRPLFFVSCQFANETVYMWSGVGTFSWGGHSWVGLGKLGGISPVAETINTQAQGITLTLSGIPTDLLTDALSNFTVSGRAQVWLGFLLDSGALLTDPIPVYLGTMDQPTVDMSTETATISIDVENKLSDLNRARGGRYTDQDQRQRHPGDGGLKYVQWLQDMNVNWRG